MPANMLRERIRDAILEIIDKAAWEHCAKVEAAERDNIRAVWQGVFSYKSQNSGGAP
jgi:hypothetical protein